MYVFTVRNVHEALPFVLNKLKEVGLEKPSRNGDVLVFPEPVMVEYEKPLERVLYHADRDANPYFHFFESLWMLAGRNDTEYPCRFVKRMSQYSDNGSTFHGAYGHRWRNHFSIDQLQVVVEMLKANPDDRRAIVSMWDANVDGLGRTGKDYPCNLQALFRIEEGVLNMTVTNRSNDIIWGAFGANAVHFSYLLEFMAIAIGVPVGRYYQFSNNFHAYKDTFEQCKDIKGGRVNPYEEQQGIKHVPLINTDLVSWHADLGMFLSEGNEAMGYKDKFFRTVACPMLKSFETYRHNKGVRRYEAAQQEIMACKDTAWLAAVHQWLERRKVNFIRAQDDGVNYESN